MGDTEPTLAVAEHFYSVQGEGPYVGTPAVFLRLAGCNLLCGDPPDPEADADDLEPGEDATWVCDSIPVWRTPDETLTAEALADKWEASGILDHLRDGAHLILTGGEPTLENHQRGIVALVKELTERDARPFVEVETNGTQMLSEAFVRATDHYNVSLKLSNSGMDEERRLVTEAIQQYVEVRDAVFKFVVTAADVDEVHDLIERFGIPAEQVMLMPAGQTREQLADTGPAVAETCKAEGWRYSPRAHIDLWNTATGV